jgi:hypothetical protein
VIEHDEPHFHLERTHISGESSDTFSINLTTDGKIVVTNHAGFEISASLHWERQTLVFDSRLDRQGEQARNIVRYQLSDKGRVFTAEERFCGGEHNYENKWVFDKQ